ncbi:MAG: peptidoglycan-binding protein [Alphaproteobacteria bacterium]
MKTVLLATAMAFAISGPALASYAEGEVAFNQGNYWRALQELDGPANQGDPRAQYLLGRMYMDGNGVNQDYLQAHMWLNLATTGGVAHARDYRDAVGSRMSPQQLARAQEMARTWNRSPGASPAGSSQPATIGYSVRNAQYLLNRLGYNAGPEDGEMGGSTRSGIAAYQRAQGVHADGRLSQELFDRMAVDAGYAGNARAATGAAGGMDEPAEYSPLVADVQSKLRDMDYGVSGVTGRMNAETRAAIRKYEADAGMRATGRANAALLSRLEAHEKRSERRETLMVRRAQHKLDRLGYDIGPDDGEIGWRTRNAVRQFQTDRGLRADGEIDRALLDALDASLQARYGSGDVDRTAERDTARKIEAALNRQGYDAGDENGRIDDRARAAIRQYQQDWGLRADGQSSTGLLAHIENPPSSGRMGSPALVRDVKRELDARGYAVGTIDGRIDGQLTAAVRTWQSDARVTVDGEVDEALLAEIRASRVTRAEGSPRDAAGTLLQGITDSILENMRKE